MPGGIIGLIEFETREMRGLPFIVPCWTSYSRNRHKCTGALQSLAILPGSLFVQPIIGIETADTIGLHKIIAQRHRSIGRWRPHCA